MNTETEKKPASAQSDLTDVLAAAIKEYGEACHDYGIGNPMNLAQMNRLYALTQEAWGKVSKILDDLKAANGVIQGPRSGPAGMGG